MRKFIALLLPIIFALMVSCGSQGNSPVEHTGVKVVTSVYPLYELVHQVGGNRVEVTNLVPAGSEPHDMELTPGDINTLMSAKLIVYIGGGFQPALEEALQNIDSEVVKLDVTKGLQTIPASQSEGTEHDHSEEHASEELAFDPHVWLDPVLMKQITYEIRDTLSQIDQRNKAYYEENASNYAKQLDQLNSEFERGLSNCRTRYFITSHAAFGYLARRYNLIQVPITGLSPESEPSPKRMQEVVELARKHQAKVIYFETLVDPRVAETIANEVGAKTMVLNPIESLTPEQEKAGKDYIELMKENLQVLREGLECK
ncbi:periplasmic solute binding protein [Thermobaculum terrenum ATCC BAA-798]|uniref:Periplasmic solute binding protein n=1 Tax=Thermobaculum terrenum (strain ATCC BAA-798 / CCMEE 7001 / YNP1) TaxID=525904 RepID=D1CCG9_THET1|nr:metal ABC transporter substrate-binding protein [Thermobaculum terrenum]ACZ42484.1 periplasmic solute binding protein [Thermobaculum terrenum ATCC BAA-798]